MQGLTDGYGRANPNGYRIESKLRLRIKIDKEASMRTSSMILCATVLATTSLLNSAVAADNTSPPSASSTTAFSDAERATSLIGKNVRAEGKTVGELDNVIVDLESGRVLYAVVDLGEQKVAVPPGVFTHGSGSALELNATREKLRAAPRFTSQLATDSEIGKASLVYQAHKHFGQSAWWQGSTAADQGSFNNVHRVTDLRGTRIKNVQDSPVGEVQNAVVDLPSGRVLYVVMSPESDLDPKGSFYALPPQALTRASASPQERMLVTNLDKDKLASAPHFSRNDWSRIRDRSFASQVYNHYGKQPYFDNGSTLTPTGRDSGYTKSDQQRREDRDDLRREREEDLRQQREAWRERQDRLDRQQDRIEQRRDILNEQRDRLEEQRRDVLNSRPAVTNVTPRSLPPANRNRDGATRDRSRYSDRDRDRTPDRGNTNSNEGASSREPLDSKDTSRNRLDQSRNN